MDASQEFRDIEEAMAQPIRGIHDAARDAELEGRASTVEMDRHCVVDELESLLAADKATKHTINGSPLKLPEVPGGERGVEVTRQGSDQVRDLKETETFC